jgi:hypothetical protein
MLRLSILLKLLLMVSGGGPVASEVRLNRRESG